MTLYLSHMPLDLHDCLTCTYLLMPLCLHAVISSCLCVSVLLSLHAFVSLYSYLFMPLCLHALTSSCLCVSMHLPLHAFFVCAKHIIVGRLFRNIHPSLQYSSHSRIHTCLYDFFPHMYIPHYASSPWLQCAQFSFLSFSQ